MILEFWESRFEDLEDMNEDLADDVGYLETGVENMV